MSAGPDPLPAAATERLRDAQARPFTSALSVPEALLVRESGLEPIAQVMGSSVFKIGWQFMPGAGRRGMWGSGPRGQTFELETRTEAFNSAREAAVRRLREEAELAGADAVVGVSIRRTTRDMATDLVEFVATGTAVRSIRYEIADEERPWLSNLSGQDAAKLIREGFWPVGIVGGSCVAYAASGFAQNRSQGLFWGMRNQELADFTRGVTEARLMAMERVERGAHRLHAHGVVGVTFERTQREVEQDVNNTKYRDLIIEIHVLGTAIVEVQGPRRERDIFIALPLT